MNERINELESQVSRLSNLVDKQDALEKEVDLIKEQVVRNKQELKKARGLMKSLDDYFGSDFNHSLDEYYGGD